MYACVHRRHLRNQRLLAGLTVLLGMFLAGAAQAGTAPASAPGAAVPSAAMSLNVDLSRASQRIVGVHQTLAVAPGALTLYYPQWIPGENLPSGPIDNVAGLRIEANGQRLAWRRDTQNMYALHLQVPPGVARLDLQFDYLSPTRAGDLASYSPSATQAWAVLEFNQLLFYPAGQDVHSIQAAVTLNLPVGWQFASALPVDSRNGNQVTFRAVDLVTLVDSPVQAGAYFRRIDLAADTTPVRLNIVGDNAKQQDMAAARIDGLGRVVREAYALLGPPHYHQYDFLLTRSMAGGGFGLEHLQSSDDRFTPGFMGAADTDLRALRVLPHELVHSWNGKFRRPAGMLSTDFNTPMNDQLQWVYEGLTDYWACLLTTRGGLWSEQDYRDWLAEVSAWMAHQQGRQWRPLQDTADAAPRDQDSDAGWANWRRSTDFYPEGELLWLDVDASIRKLSGNKRSLDDFAKAFFAAGAPDASVSAYTFDDVVTLLNQVQPNDWNSFLRQRLDQVGDALPEQGLAQAGWKLVYSPVPSTYVDAMRGRGEDLGVTYALGFSVSDSGIVRDVIWNGPAFQAGLAPGMRIRSVNGGAWSVSLLHDTISHAESSASAVAAAPAVASSSGASMTIVDADAAAGTPHAMTLQVDDMDRAVTFTLNYHGGLRYPRLQRLPGQADLLHDSVGARVVMAPAAVASTPAPAASTR